MISLVELLSEKRVEHAMWTYEDALSIAQKVGGKIVGSVKTKGYSNNDLDIKIDKYTPDIESLMRSIGYEYVGSQVVSPEEIRKSRKFSKDDRFWLRNYIFLNGEDKKIELWIVIPIIKSK